MRLSPWSAVPGLTASLVLPTGTYADLPWMLLQVRLGLDATARVFLFFTALLWLLAGAYARTYSGQRHPPGGIFCVSPPFDEW